MSFLQPFLLAALPLVALPIIIHLINQRRYQTVKWAAMMFLLAANRMSRGYARLRQWLIMAMRMAAIAALVFAVSRPLAGGWLGLAAGGRADTTIILLDRSPSMQQSGSGAAGSKLETGVRKLAETLETLGSGRWVLIDSATKKPRELEKVQELLTSTSTGPASSSADLAGHAARGARLHQGQQGRPHRDLDLLGPARKRLEFRRRPLAGGARRIPARVNQSVRIHLLAYPDVAKENMAIRVTDVRRRKTKDGAELLLRLKVTRQEADERRDRRPGSDRARRRPVGGHFASRRRGRAQGPSDSARERTRSGLGPGIDSGRRQPRRQRLLVRLRAARAQAHDHRGRRPADRAVAHAWRRRSRPIPRSNARPKWCAHAQVAAIDWDQVSLLLVARAAARARFGQADPVVHRARRLGHLFSAQEPRRRRAVRRPVHEMGRPTSRRYRWSAGAATKICSPRPPSGAPLAGRGPRSSQILRAFRRGDCPCHLERRAAAPGASARRTTGRFISARPRPRRQIPRWRPPAWCSTCSSSVPWPRGQPRWAAPERTQPATRRETTRPSGSGFRGQGKPFRPITPFKRGFTRPASGCWPSIARRPKHSPRSWPTPR